MRAIQAFLIGSALMTSAALAQATPETSDKPSGAASPAAPVKTGSERRREESAAEQGHPLPGTEMNDPSGQGRPADQAPSAPADRPLRTAEEQRKKAGLPGLIGSGSSTTNPSAPAPAGAAV